MYSIPELYNGYTEKRFVLELLVAFLISLKC